MENLRGLPNNASEAKKLGLRFYYSGHPCKRGHLAKRLASNSNCEECRIEKQLNSAKHDSRDLVFSEAGLLAAVKDCKNRDERIDAMIKYYYGCLSLASDRRLKDYIAETINILRAKRDDDKPAKRMFNKTPKAA